MCEESKLQPHTVEANHNISPQAPQCGTDLRHENPGPLLPFPYFLGNYSVRLSGWTPPQDESLEHGEEGPHPQGRWEPPWGKDVKKGWCVLNSGWILGKESIHPQSPNLLFQHQTVGWSNKVAELTLFLPSLWSRSSPLISLLGMRCSSSENLFWFGHMMPPVCLSPGYLKTPFSSIEWGIPLTQDLGSMGFTRPVVLFFLSMCPDDHSDTMSLWWHSVCVWGGLLV